MRWWYMALAIGLGMLGTLAAIGSLAFLGFASRASGLRGIEVVYSLLLLILGALLLKAAHEFLTKWRF